MIVWNKQKRVQRKERIKEKKNTGKKLKWCQNKKKTNKISIEVAFSVKFQQLFRVYYCIVFDIAICTHSSFFPL